MGYILCYAALEIWNFPPQAFPVIAVVVYASILLDISFLQGSLN